MSAPEPVLSAFAWFDIDDARSPQLDELARRFNLHPLQIEDCRHRPQRAKTEERGEYIFTVLKHSRSASTVEFDDLDIFFSADYLITIHSKNCHVIDTLRVRIEQEKPQRLDRIFYMLIDLVVDEYQPLLDAIADDIADIESEVLSRPEPDMLARIFSLKRGLIEFRRVAGAMREVVNTLARHEGGFLGDDLDPYFRDVYDHLVRTAEFIESYRDLLTGSLDIYLSAVANRTNEVMKVLTIWGTIALPLIIITGFFGMNLKLPWIDHPHGTAFAGMLMIASTLSVLVYFKSKKWF